MGSLVPRTVLPLPSAQAHELGRDLGVLVDLRALVQSFVDALRVSWCEYESRARRNHPYVCMYV